MFLCRPFHLRHLWRCYYIVASHIVTFARGPWLCPLWRKEPASAPLLRVGCSARFNDLQHTCPSIAPNYSFTHGWWGPLVVLWKKLDAFEGMDYLIPTLSTDGTGFIAGPCRLESAL